MANSSGAEEPVAMPRDGLGVWSASRSGDGATGGDECPVSVDIEITLHVSGRLWFRGAAESPV